MGLWNVIAATLAAWGFGVIWYRANGPRRAALTGSAMRWSPALAIASGAVLFVAAGFLRHIYYVSNLTSNVGLGFVAGLGVGLFFIGPWLLLSSLADARSPRLALIDGGYASLAFAIIGGVLVAF